MEGAGRGWEEASTLMSWTRVGRGFNSKELDEGGKRLQLNESIDESKLRSHRKFEAPSESVVAAITLGISFSV